MSNQVSIKNAQRLSRSLWQRSASSNQLANGRMQPTRRNRDNTLCVPANIAAEMRRIAELQVQIAKAIDRTLEETTVEIHL